jgi:hypothetical protein
MILTQPTFLPSGELNPLYLDEIKSYLDSLKVNR